MRILANYGYKTNGDSYSVTFETIGDVPAAHAPQTVDELFRLAKEAVQRQLAGAGTLAAPQPPTPVTVPQPVSGQGDSPKAVTQTPPAQTNGHGKRPQIKDPHLPATPPQLGLLKKLAKEKGRRFDDLTDLTKGEASEKIGELMAL